MSSERWATITDVAGLSLGCLTFGPPYYARLSDGTALQWGYDTVVEQYGIMPGQMITMFLFLYGLLHNRGCIAYVLNCAPVASFGRVVFPFYLYHYVVTMFTLSGAWVPVNQGQDAFKVDNTNVGAVFPLGGLALTWVLAYLVIEYFQPNIMRHIEPRMAMLAASLMALRFTDDDKRASPMPDLEYSLLEAEQAPLQCTPRLETDLF